MNWFKRIERQLECAAERDEVIIRLLKKILADVEAPDAVSAKGEVMPKTVEVGGPVTFTFTEFAAPVGTATVGVIVPESGPITFASDNTAVATVDGSQQVVNADNSISVPVVAVGPGTANITGVDPASANKVAAGDVLTVIPPPPPVAVTATGVLS